MSTPNHDDIINTNLTRIVRYQESQFPCSPLHRIPASCSSIERVEQQILQLPFVNTSIDAILLMPSSKPPPSPSNFIIPYQSNLTQICRHVHCDSSFSHPADQTDTTPSLCTYNDVLVYGHKEELPYFYDRQVNRGESGDVREEGVGRRVSGENLDSGG